jgi:hypothetical protein
LNAQTGTFSAHLGLFLAKRQQGDATMNKANPKSRDQEISEDLPPSGAMPIGKIPPLPIDQLPAGDDPTPVDQGRVPPVPSRDEANVDPDDALPDDREEEILEDDPGREKTRFDEEMPRSSR